jgi:MFS transporter, DHA1 family, tetracycline resistance protein
VRRATFAFVFFVVLLDVLALGIMIPVLPKLVIAFAGGDRVGATAFYGAFGTLWALMQFLCAPLLGALSDRYGRRPVILVSCLGLGFDYLLMAMAPSLGWLFVGRAISGITAASFATGFAYVADVTPPAQRAARFGMLGAAFGTGFVIGPALGGLLGSVDLRLPFWVAGALSLANAGYGFFILPESLPPAHRAAFAWSKANPLAALRFLRSYPALLGLAAAAFLYRLGHDALPNIFVLYGDYRFGWSERTVGWALAAVGVCAVAVQAGLVRVAVRRCGARQAMLIGLGFGAVAFTIYGLAPTPVLFCIGIPVGALFGFSYPAMQTLMTAIVGANEQGRLQGALASLMGVAGVLAPLAFTQVFAAAIGPFRGWGLPGAPFLLAAAVLIAAAVVGGRAGTRIAG